jgi:hypothetical protein
VTGKPKEAPGFRLFFPFPPPLYPDKRRQSALYPRIKGLSPFKPKRPGEKSALKHTMNRVVQKLQFLNNNRLKTAKNADFVKNMRFLEDLFDNQPGYRTSLIYIVGQV